MAGWAKIAESDNSFRVRRLISNIGGQRQLRIARPTRTILKFSGRLLLPEDDLVKAYLNERHKFPFEPRQPGGKSRFFSSEAGRQLLEREFLLAGVRIRARCKKLPAISFVHLGLAHLGWASAR